MDVCSVVLALSLLNAPPDPNHESRSDLFATTRLPLTMLCLEMELMDPKEVLYMLVRPEDFANDLNVLRERRIELEDAPSARDAYRFPDRHTINEFLCFNRAYRNYLERQQARGPYDYWRVRAVIQETDRLYQIWDYARDAACDYYHISVRRRGLKDLRDLIGYDAYYKGQMPPYVPLEYFRPIQR